MVRTSVALVFRLTESAVRNFNRIDNAITRMERAAERGTETTRRFNAAMTAAGTASAVGLTLAAKNAATLEDALARLETVTRSTTQTVATSLSNAEVAAREFATQYSASTADLITAQFELATAGVKVEEQIVGVQQAFLLAKATVGDFTQTTQLLGQLLNTFGKSAQLGYLEPMAKVERLTDTLASTVQRFQATLPVLQQGLKFIVGPAQQLGLKFEEVAVALGILNTAGFRGTLAGTALSNMFNKLSRAVEKLDLDPSKFQDLEGNLTSLADFMREVNKALSDLSPLEGQIRLIEVFDIRAGRVIKTLSDNAEAIEKVSNELELARGSTKAMADIVETTTSATLKQFVNAWQNVATIMGKVVNDSIKGVLTSLTSLARNVAAFVQAFPNLTTGLAALVTVILLASAALFAWKIAILPGIKFTWGLVAAIGKLVFTMSALTVRIAGTLIFFGLLIGAEISATLATWGLNTALAALLALIIELLVISVIGIIIYGIVKAIVALVSWLWSLIGVGEEVNKLTDKTTTGMRKLQMNFTDTTSKAGILAAELDRLGKALQFGTKVSGSIESSLGITNLASRIREIQQEFLKSSKSLPLDEAIKQAVAEIGEAGIARELGEKIFGSALAKEAGEGFQRSLKEFQKFDDRDSPLNVLRIFSQLAKEAATANRIAIRSIVSDTTQVVEVFEKLSRLNIRIPALDPIERAGTLLNTQKELAESFIKSLNQLQNVKGFQAVAEQAFRFGLTAEASGKKFDKFMKNFLKSGTEANKIWMALRASVELQNKATDKAAVGIKELISSYERYKEVVQKVRTGTIRLETAIGKLEKGVVPVAKATKDVNDRLAFLELQEKRVGEQAIKMAAQIEVAKKTLGELGGTTPEELQKLSKQLTFIERDQLKLRATIDEGELNRDLALIFNRLTGVKLGDAAAKNLKSTASALESVLGDVISEGVSGPISGAKIRNALREMFTGQAAKQAALQFASVINGGLNDVTKSFRVETSKALQAVQKQFEQALQVGDFAKAAMIQADALKQVEKQMLGLGFAAEETENKLTDVEKQLNKIAVAGITATSGQAAALDQLQRILSRSVTTPGDRAALNADLVKFIELENQIGRGSGVAAREAATALTRSLNDTDIAAKNQVQTLVTMQNIVRTETDNFGNTIRSSMQEMGRAAGQAASILSPVFEMFSKGAEAVQRMFGGGGPGQQKIEALVELKSGGTTFEINVNGSGNADLSNFLEEDEIQEIVDEVKKKLQEEMDEKIRQLEDRLRK